MESGKRFEARFAKSLKQLPGAMMRIEDGGERAKNYQFGDFFYWDYGGNSWLIECKATNRASFPIAQLRIEQMAKLKLYDGLGHGRHSVIAINFYRDPIREYNECLLIAWPLYEMLYQKALEKDRASIPRSWLERFGHLQESTTIYEKRERNGETVSVPVKVWELDFERLLHD